MVRIKRMASNKVVLVKTKALPATAEVATFFSKGKKEPSKGAISCGGLSSREMTDKIGSFRPSLLAVFIVTKVELEGNVDKTESETAGD